MNEILKKNIKRVCKKWKMTQEEMSVSFNFSENAIPNMMQGRQKFADEIVQGLANLCRVSVEAMETVELGLDEIPNRVTMKVAEPKPTPCDEVVKLKDRIILELENQIKDKNYIIELLKLKKDEK